MLRARIVLLAAEGKQNCDIAVAAGTDRFTVARWRNRFIRLRLRGIEKDAPRPGRLPRFSQEMVLEIVRKTTQELPANATHWSTRRMAKAVGVSEATVRRIWHQHGLKPHLIRTFKLAKATDILEKVKRAHAQLDKISSV